MARGTVRYHDRPPRFGPVVLWRLSARFHATGHARLAKVTKGLVFLIFKAVLPPEVAVAKDVRLDHYGLGVVIHPNTIIGHRVRLLHGVTLGSDAAIGTEDRIVIGDDVEIGARACVINRAGGSLTVGAGARIGAGAVVVDDVAPGVTVVGVPARPVRAAPPGGG